MTLFQKIDTALDGLGIPVEEDFFGDGQKQYITFTLTRDGAAVMADNEPQNEVADLQIHWFLPRDIEFFSTQKQIRRRLLNAGFTWPVITSLVEPDNKTRHIIFECEVENDEELEVD
jgi:hypothetical protein